MELVWEQYFAHHFRTTASAFYYPIHSLIAEQVDPANGNAFFTNAGALDLRGVDFELARRIAAWPGIYGQLQLSGCDQRDHSHTSHEFSETPRPGKP